jgi:hypothetical protein
MKKQLLALLAPALAFTSLSQAAIVGQTFTGTTTFNWVEAGDLTEEFPVGTRWTLKVEWDDSAPYTDLYSNQASYALTKLTLTLEGKGGTWTTSSLPNQASFGLGNFGGQDSVQFTSGWGPADHTNQVIEDWQPYSINLSLTAPLGSAISALDQTPKDFDPGKWLGSDFKIYLNNDGNRSIVGTADPAPVIINTDLTVLLANGKELKDGKSVVNLGKSKVGKSGRTSSFKITNSGNTNLKKINVSLSGVAKRDYRIIKPRKSTLAPGKSTTFKVVFKPSKKGTRKALIRISNSTDKKKTFQIPVKGIGR